MLRFNTMQRTWNQRGLRTLVLLVPLVLALFHALGFLPSKPVRWLDHAIYDARLRASMPGTLEPRVVIVDIDDRSLADIGPWPWPREQVARLVNTLFEQQRIAVLGFDIVFPEPDPHPHGDVLLARALQNRPVVLGYYFSNEPGVLRTGALPAPVLQPEALRGRPVDITRWDGFESNLHPLAQAAPHAGAFNALPDPDGMVRSLPLLVEHAGRAHESLALAVFRRLLGSPELEPGFATGVMAARHFGPLESLRLVHDGQTLTIPVDERVAALIPFRGGGGPEGGSFTYLSATDLLAGRVPADTLRGRIVLVGTSAPALKDLRTTPVGANYPGVETHANLITGLLDGHLPVRPDYALGYELVVLVVSGLVLTLLLPGLGLRAGAVLAAAVLLGVVALNSWLHLSKALVMPLAATVLLVVFTSVLGLLTRRSIDSNSRGGVPCSAEPFPDLSRLCAAYGVERLATDLQRQRQPELVWQEVDRLRSAHGGMVTTIHTPLGAADGLSQQRRDELRLWQHALRAWRAQDWDACDVHLLNLQRQNAKKVLYRIYSERVACRRQLPADPAWDGTTPITSIQASQSGAGTTGHTMPESQ